MVQYLRSMVQQSFDGADDILLNKTFKALLIGRAFFYALFDYVGVVIIFKTFNYGFP